MVTFLPGDTMRKVADVAAETLTWKETSSKEFVLQQGDIQVGRLTFRNSWGTQATAESGDGAWTFKRVGFFRPVVTVRRAGSEEDIAAFHNNTWSRGGSLRFADGGPTFHATTNFWHGQYEITTDGERSLVKMHYGGFFRLHADVEIVPEARVMPQLPILVLLSWYLAVMLHRDSTAAGAAAAAAAG